MRGCTPHFQTLKEGVNRNTLGLKQNDSDLSEQQLKVLRLGDPLFSADQYKKGRVSGSTAASISSNSKNEKTFADNALSHVVLSPGDVLYHPAGTSFLFSFPLPHSLSLPTVTIYFFNSMFFKLYPVCISLGFNLSYPIPFALILSILYRPIDVSNIYLFIPLFIHYFMNSFTFSFYIFLTNSTSLYFRWI